MDTMTSCIFYEGGFVDSIIRLLMISIKCRLVKRTYLSSNKAGSVGSFGASSFRGLYQIRQSRQLITQLCSPKKTDKIEVESDDEELQVLRQAMQQIDLFHQLCLKFPERFRLAENSKQAITIFRSGGIAGFLGLEGLHQIGNSASVLRLFHRLGVRYITLCHSESNQYADSAVGI